MMLYWGKLGKKVPYKLTNFRELGGMSEKTKKVIPGWELSEAM